MNFFVRIELKDSKKISYMSSFKNKSHVTFCQIKYFFGQRRGDYFFYIFIKI